MGYFRVKLNFAIFMAQCTEYQYHNENSKNEAYRNLVGDKIWRRNLEMLAAFFEREGDCRWTWLSYIPKFRCQS